MAQSSSSGKSSRKKTTSTAKATPKPSATKKSGTSATKATTKKSTTPAPKTGAAESEGAAKAATTGAGASTPKSTGPKTVEPPLPEEPSKTATDSTADPKDPIEAASKPLLGKTAAPSTPAPAKKHGPNATLEPSALAEFSQQPPQIQQVIEAALALTKRQLTYTYGSANPESGGMDCSGTIYYLLRAHGVRDVPRDSASQYAWLRKAGTFRAVVSKSPTSFEFDELRPGDLLFWSGTYSVEREIPVSHVMLYLGTEKGSKKRVMFGASDGRTYDNVQRWGVSVFDFKMPRAETSSGERSKVDFLGYARIPALQTGTAALVAKTDPAPILPETASGSEAIDPIPVVPATSPKSTSKTASGKTASAKSRSTESSATKTAAAQPATVKKSAAKSTATKSTGTRKRKTKS